MRGASSSVARGGVAAVETPPLEGIVAHPAVTPIALVAANAVTTKAFFCILRPSRECPNCTHRVRGRGVTRPTDTRGEERKA